MKNGLFLMIWMCLGFILWSSAFIILYAGHAYLCETGADFNIIRITLAILIGLHLMAFAVSFKIIRSREQIFSNVSLWVLIGGLIATCATFLPSLLLSPCL